MIKTTTREIASSSDVNAPVFYFKEYVRGLEYHNNGRQIDFVTDGNSLYVPSTDNVTACKDSIKEDGGFMRLVSEGKPGIQGLKGDPGRDGRTPSVFARFDGRQMIFYTNEINEDGTPKTDDNGNPVTRRIAATNDLTGPSWRPKKVDDTIIWEKTRDDSQPESINLSDLVKETAPVIFRVDSDNTKRSDETSGPANYIQWKYEGDEYWNNLISISELMNLALAGVCIWFDETDQEYHLGHRQVLHATYDSSKSGKRIISDVEHGDVLYDAGPIHLPDFEADIAALWEEVCALKDRVEAIEEELPKFVKAVIINDKLNKPDEDGVVDLGAFDFYTKEESDEKFQPVGDYIKKTDLKFEVRNEEGGRFLYMSLDNGSTWTKIYEATCVCKKEEDPTVYYTIFFETPTPSTATMTYSGTVKYPGSQVRVPAGTTVVLEADAEGYEHYKETKLINADYHFAPVLTEESAPEVKYGACVIDNTGLADRIYIGTTSANKQQACLENLSNGTTVYGKATRSGYKDKTVSGVINNDDLELPITGEWESSSISVTGVSINDGKNYTMCLGDAITHTFKATVTPSNATNKSVKWRSVNPEYLTINETTGLATPKKTTDTLSTGYVTVIAITDDGGHEAECKVVIEDCSEPGPDPEITLEIYPSILEFDANQGSKTFTVNTNNPTGFSVDEDCDWITFTKNNNVVTVTVDENNSSTRACDIKVTAGDVWATVTVTQDEPVSDTYTVIAKPASCDPAITVVGLSENEDGPFTPSLTFNKGTTHDVWVKANREGFNERIMQSNVSEDDLIVIIPCGGWIQTVTYTLTINGNGETVKYRINNGAQETYNSVLTLNADDTVKLDATKSGFTATWNDVSVDRTPLSPSNNEFTMIKDTSINITWTEVTPETYTVNTSISGGSCSSSDKPDTLTISKTQNGTYGSSLTFNKDSGDHTVYVKATKREKVDKTWTETVNGATTITLDSSDALGCSWENVTVPCSVSGVTVSPSTLTLTEGQTNTLSKTVNSTGTCENTVTWSSTNTSVATVDKSSGKVTAVSAGKATIKATSDDNETKFGQCAVTVNAPTYTASVNAESGCAPTSYTLTSGSTSVNDKSLSGLSNGASVTLTAKRTGYKDKVKTGTVSKQNLVFTIACSDWEEQITTKCVTSINVKSNKDFITLESGNNTLQMTAEIEPSDATNKEVTWESNFTDRATVDQNGKVTGVAPGIVIIKATAKDECGVSGSKAITVGKPITIINAMPNTYDFGINDAVDVDTPRYVLAGQTNTYYVDGTNANSAITVKVRDGQDLTNKYIGYTSNCSAIADSTTPEKLRSNGKITGFNYCDNITITLSVIDNA